MTMSRARSRDIFGVIRFRLPGFNSPVILRHRLERTQKVTAICRDFPSIPIAERITAGENIDGPNASGETSHSRAPLGTARGENGNVSLE
jgi:hypothetical protein